MIHGCISSFLQPLNMICQIASSAKASSSTRHISSESTLVASSSLNPGAIGLTILSESVILITREKKIPGNRRRLQHEILEGKPLYIDFVLTTSVHVPPVQEEDP